MVNITTLKPFPSNSLNLVITGNEEISFHDLKSNKKIQRQRSILNFVIPLKTVSGDTYSVEKNIFPFSILLPSDLPSSFHCSPHKENFAWIHYNIWAGLINKKKNKYLFTNEVLNISQKYSSWYEELNDFQEYILNQGCLSKKGKLPM